MIYLVRKIEKMYPLKIQTIKKAAKEISLISKVTCLLLKLWNKKK
jgi:hypothetical protein